MTEWEWPPDEISGPAEDSKPIVRGQGARASAAVPRPDQPTSGAPMAGVPMAVPAPQAGIPLAGPQPVAGGADLTRTMQVPLPPLPQRERTAVPLPPTAVPVQPHSAPIPLPPQQVGPPIPPPVPAPPTQPAPQAVPAPPADARAGIPTPAAEARAAAPVEARAAVPAPPAEPRPTTPFPPTDGRAAVPFPAAEARAAVPFPAPEQGQDPTGDAAASPATAPVPPARAAVTAVPPPQTAPGVWPVSQAPHIPPLPTTPAAPAPPQFGGPQQPGPGGGEVYLPTAEEFARRRATRPADPVAHMGIQAALRKSTFGLLNLSPGQREQEIRRATDLVRRNFGGLRQITVVNPKGGAGKTVAVLLLAMTFGRKRGGYVLAWDNNETQGTLGMRSQQDFHSRTVRDLMRDLHQFQGSQSRVGDLSQYVRSQGDGMFEVLASDESATAGEMLTAHAFAEIREVVSRFYKLIMVDTGNNVRAENWQAAIDATDQLVVTMSARNDSAETAARMLDHLEQTGRSRLVRQAVTIVSLPPSRRELDIPAIERHFAARTRAVLIAPYERMLDSGEPIDYGRLTEESQDAWLRIAAAVAEGL
ncbi:MinD/ParA family ATP-binding protein [Catellatospora citrea]|uniref:Chromosome partitioning protein n=1 Tax=Catellatospora citrea TaxID=53366 RepID=A0A8J3KJ61_9ACTN|nr:ParA family protein [Catellatospora citrea]RKE09002.1 MinD-like ATPase involved in chromosome partitioning or flagellar assembly [Catellatospora citrea]GIG01850.1 chromosome partitioning protein [Catellatospora citrea]